jgi:fructose-1-phosphate kinase PfkB-like protein
VDSDKKLLVSICRLHQLGIKTIVVSLGKDGAVGSDGQSLLKATPPPVQVVNTIGSGDALLAGLIFALVKGLPFNEALKFAVATGTANTLVDGPGYIDIKTLHEIFGEVKVQRLL